MSFPSSVRFHRFFRFRRWSRKSYSAFASLRLQVSIGFLAKGVVEALCRKDGKIFSVKNEKELLSEIQKRESVGGKGLSESCTPVKMLLRKISGYGVVSVDFPGNGKRHIKAVAG